jgi:hypothetical protein
VRRLWGVFAVVLLVGLAACDSGGGAGEGVTASPSAPASPTPSDTTIPADWFGSANGPGLLAAGMPGAVQLPRPSVVKGPHFVYAFGTVAVMRQLPGPLADAFGLDPGATPAPGRELVLVQTVAPPAGDSPFSDEGLELPDRVEIVSAPGINLTPIFRRDAPAGVYGFSVPIGAHPTLRVTDEGRTQSIDLRTGRLGRDVVPGAYAQREGRFTKSGEPSQKEWIYLRMSGGGSSSVPASRRYVGAYMTSATAATSPWDDDLGWAPAGRTWLVLEPSVSAGQVQGFELELEITLAAASFRVTGPDGKTYPVKGDSATATPIAEASTSLTAAVPAGLTSVTVRFYPVATATGEKGKVTLTPYLHGPQKAVLKLR